MITKHRDEVDDISVDFAPWLGVGETISTPVVTVLKRSGAVWADVTANFVGTPAPAIVGSILSWRAKAGTGLTQPGNGTYAAHHKVSTNQARTLVYIEDIKIDARATV
jgi:hypothetical protein